MKISLLLLGLMTTPVFCSNPLKIHEATDLFDGERIISTDPIVLRHVHFESNHSGYLAVVLQRSQRPNASPRFHLEIFCGPKKSRQMEILPGQTLTVWINDKRISFYSQGTGANQTAPGAREAIKPHVLYEDIPASDLDDMGRAEKLEMRVSGSTDSLQGELDSQDLELFRQFVDNYVDKNP